MRREQQTHSQFLGELHIFVTSNRSDISLATIPTVGDALSSLSALSTELSQTLKQITDLGAELAAHDHIAVDNITDVSTFNCHLVRRVFQLVPDCHGHTHGPFTGPGCRAKTPADL